MHVDLTAPSTSIRSLEDIELTATVTNPGSGPVRLDTRYLAIAALVFEVRDPHGTVIPMMPPLMPDVDDGSGRTTLDPGESASFSYHGRNFFGFPLDPGDYTFRFRYHAVNAAPAHDWEGTLQSAAVVLTVQH